MAIPIGWIEKANSYFVSIRLHHPRHMGTVLEPLWTLFDLTPLGRAERGRSRSSTDSAAIQTTGQLEGRLDFLTMDLKH